MTRPEGLQALREANPRTGAAFREAVDESRELVWSLIDAEPELAPPARRRRPRRRGPVIAFGVTTVLAVLVAITLTSTGDRPGVESAAAAVSSARMRTAASAEESGTAVVRMTHDGRPWAGKTVRWNGADVAIVEDPSPNRPGGRGLLVVGGVLYGQDPEGGWLKLGDPAAIDRGSGTTPDEYLTAVLDDVRGASVRRLTSGMRDLETTHAGDGSTVYRGTVAAGLVARESGFKEGHTIRVFPFGYVAHDAAADPTAPLDASVTVGPDGVIGEAAVRWGTWTYTVSYSGLGTTPAPEAPANARSLSELRRPGANG